jgi:hypothetical protein
LNDVWAREKLGGMNDDHQISGSNFVVRIEDGYVYERIWGRIDLEEAEKSAASVIELAKLSSHRSFLLDINGLEWINDLAVRRRGVQLMNKGRGVFDRVALISRRSAIVYLVTILARGGGLEVKDFTEKESAIEWLTRSRGVRTRR